MVATIGSWVIWLAFAGELALRLAIDPERRGWLRTHPLEVAIVVFTPPFLPSTCESAQTLRLLRLLRVAAAARTLRGALSIDGIRWATVRRAGLTGGNHTAAYLVPQMSVLLSDLA